MDFMGSQDVTEQALGRFSTKEIENAKLTEGEIANIYEQTKSFSECYAREGGERLSVDLVDAYTALRIGGMPSSEAEVHLGSAMDRFASTQDGCYVKPPEQSADAFAIDSQTQEVQIQKTPTPSMGMSF